MNSKAPFCRNRKGKPYKRSCGAYNPALAPKPSNPNTDINNKTISDLKEANRVLTQELKKALEDLAAANAKSGTAHRH